MLSKIRMFIMQYVIGTLLIIPLFVIFILLAITSFLLKRDVDEQFGGLSDDLNYRKVYILHTYHVFHYWTKTIQEYVDPEDHELL